MIYMYDNYVTVFMQSTKNIHTIQKSETVKTRIIRSIFNKNERRCRDIKTQKAGWEANTGHKIKQTTFI